MGPRAEGASRGRATPLVAMVPRKCHRLGSWAPKASSALGTQPASARPTAPSVPATVDRTGDRRGPGGGSSSWFGFCRFGRRTFSFLRAVDRSGASSGRGVASEVASRVGSLGSTVGREDGTVEREGTGAGGGGGGRGGGGAAVTALFGTDGRSGATSGVRRGAGGATGTFETADVGSRGARTTSSSNDAASHAIPARSARVLGAGTVVSRDEPSRGRTSTFHVSGAAQRTISASSPSRAKSRPASSSGTRHKDASACGGSSTNGADHPDAISTATSHPTMDLGCPSQA